jgi:hypothetical protein
MLNTVLIKLATTSIEVLVLASNRIPNKSRKTKDNENIEIVISKGVV